MNKEIDYERAMVLLDFVKATSEHGTKYAILAADAQEELDALIATVTEQRRLKAIQLKKEAEEKALVEAARLERERKEAAAKVEAEARRAATRPSQAEIDATNQAAADRHNTTQHGTTESERRTV